MLPSSEGDALWGEDAPLPRQCRPVDALPVSGPGQSLAALQLADKLRGVSAPGSELQTAPRQTVQHPLCTPGGDALCQHLKARLLESPRHQA